MAVWNQSNTVFTDKGLELLSEAQVGAKYLQITRVVARDTFDTLANIRSYVYTSISQSSIKADAYMIEEPSGGVPVDGHSSASLLRVRFANDESTTSGDTSYEIRQIVVYARLVNKESGVSEQEQPYFVAQVESQSEPDIMPSRSDNPTALEYDLYILDAGEAEVTLAVRTSGFVSEDTFNSFRNEIRANIAELREWLTSQIENIKDNLVGENTRECTFTPWKPSYDSAREWSSSTSTVTFSGAKTAERFNEYGDNSNVATGSYTHVEGYNNVSADSGSTHIEGRNNYAGDDPDNPAESTGYTALRAHIEGSQNTAYKGWNQHIEGTNNLSYGYCSHIEGEKNVNRGRRSHIQGLYNTVDSDSCDTNTVSGSNNTVDSGNYNNVTNSYNENLAGDNNQLGGHNNKVRGADCTLISGNSNVITTSDNSVISGKSNNLTESDGTVVSGKNNSVTESENSNISGESNTINSSHRTYVFGKANRATMGNSETIISGNGNTVMHSEHSLVSGSTNTVDNSDNSEISGTNQHVYSGVHNLNMSGYHNTVSRNRLTEEKSGRSVLSGNDNTIVDMTASLIAGEGNNLAEVIDCIVVGYQNTISRNMTYPQSTGLYRSVFSGSNNSVTQSRNNMITGQNNNIQDYRPHGYAGENQDTQNSFIGGLSNTVNGLYSSVLTGSYNTVSDLYDSIVSGRGNNVQCTNTGANSYSNGVYAFSRNSVIQNKGNPQLVFGSDNEVSSDYVALFGLGLESSYDFQTVMGQYNVDEDKAFIIGAGTSDNDRKNIVTIDRDGTIRLAGDIYVNQIYNPDGSRKVFGESDLEDYIKPSVGEKSLVANDVNSNVANGKKAFAMNNGNRADAENSFVSGNANKANSGATNSIVSGSSNNVDGSNSAVFGNSNDIQGSYSLVSGRSHETDAGASFALITGDDNTISNSSVSAISGGQNNKIQNGSSYSAIAGGLGDEIEHSAYSFISGGHNNSISDNNYSVVAGGEENTISKTNSERDLLDNAIIVGQNSTVDDSIYSIIAGGDSNLLRGSRDSAIIGGYNLKINEDYSQTLFLGDILLGGESNTIHWCSHSSVVAGTHNTVSGERSVIAGGHYNEASGNNDFVTGEHNELRSSSSVISGGSYNCISSVHNSGIVASSHMSINMVQPESSTVSNNNFIAGSQGTLVEGAVPSGLSYCADSAMIACTNSHVGEETYVEGQTLYSCGSVLAAAGTGLKIPSNVRNLIAMGKYNDPTDVVVNGNQKYSFLIGGGTSDNNRKNVFGITPDGDVYFNGDMNNRLSTIISGLLNRITQLEAQVANLEQRTAYAVVSKDTRCIDTMTQANYDAMQTKDSNTMYVLGDDYTNPDITADDWLENHPEYDPEYEPENDPEN